MKTPKKNGKAASAEPNPSPEGRGLGGALGSEISFNINNYVSVKLTRAGINHYYAYHERYGIVTEGPNLDSNGWLKIQMHGLMEIFGEKVSMALPLMFEPEIIIHFPNTEMMDRHHQPDAEIKKL